MAEGDRERWNASWAGREPGAPSPFLVEHEALLPGAGRALDVAGGNGRNAIWLARRGLDVTLVDVSDQALAMADPSLTRVRLDLDVEPLPAGPFDVVVCVHFLDRAHRGQYVERLGPGGLLIAAQPTLRNLERHARPSARFLVAEGEMEAWVRGEGLEVVVAREGWNAEGRHEAEVIARRR
jgi:2-polyprenyl-3-methyl-5-hydroxy-6-metoxy-1,4-benzoquinol methylase